MGFLQGLGELKTVLPEARGKEEPQRVFHILFLVPMSAAHAARATSSVAGSKPTVCRSPESERATLESQGPCLFLASPPFGFPLDSTRRVIHFSLLSSLHLFLRTTQSRETAMLRAKVTQLQADYDALKRQISNERYER